MNKTTLQSLRSHPAVSEIILESDHGKTTYFINLKPGFASENGGGQTCGSESTLRGIAAFLRSVAAVTPEAPKPDAADPVALRTAEVKQAAAAVRALSAVDATLATQAAVTAALHRAEAALDAARYCALEERCATGTAPLAETIADHAELNDAARAHLSRAHADRKAYRLAGTGSDAQDAVNRAWNAAAAAEAVAHAAAAAVDTAAREHGFSGPQHLAALAAYSAALAAHRLAIEAARNA
jgi:hypothetical protein